MQVHVRRDGVPDYRIHLSDLSLREDCQARKLNKEDAMDRCKWRKVIKEAH